MKVTASNGRCEVFSFKDGLLSRLGHDVKLKVTRFELDWDGNKLSGWFDPGSLQTVCAMRDGHPDHTALSDKDKRKIDKHVRNDVLHVTKHPRIRFETSEVKADGERWEATGTLDLHGARRTLHGQARKVGQEIVCEVELHQPDYGIKPFKALLGALRLRPEVKVRLTVPIPV